MSRHEDDSEGFEVIEELTAYLDGELDERAQLLVETRLNSDPAYLAEMQALQKTWDILDQLPAAEPDRSFTQTTMEMIVGEAKKETRKGFSWIWPARALMLAAIFCGLFGISYGYLRILQTQPDRLLRQQLVTIQKHEQYDVVDLDIEFLDQLFESNLFPNRVWKVLVNKGTNDQPDFEIGDQQGIPESEKDRIDWIDGLDVEQKVELKRKLDNFLNLDSARQQEMIAFNKQLQSHPDKTELLSVLDQYFKWLRTVESIRRARLRGKPADERLASIAEIKSEQAREQLEQQLEEVAGVLPTDGDADPIFNWFFGLAKSNERKIRSHFPKAVAKYRRENNLVVIRKRIVETLARKGELGLLIENLIKIDPEFVQSIVDVNSEDGAILYSVLSPAAQEILSNQNPRDQQRLIFNWVRSVNRAFFAVSKEELETFENEELTQADRDRLDKLSSKKYLVRLKQMYREQQLPSFESNDPNDWQLNWELIPKKRK